MFHAQLFIFLWFNLWLKSLANPFTCFKWHHFYGDPRPRPVLLGLSLDPGLWSCLALTDGLTLSIQAGEEWKQSHIVFAVRKRTFLWWHLVILRCQASLWQDVPMGCSKVLSYLSVHMSVSLSALVLRVSLLCLAAAFSCSGPISRHKS